MTAVSPKNDFDASSLHNDFVVQAGGRHTGRRYRKRVDVEQILKEHPEAVPWVDWDGRSALISAVEGGNLSNVRLLLAAGANPDAEDRQGHTALNIAATIIEENSVELIDLLLDKGAAVDAQDKQGQTALMKAVQNRSLTYATPVIEKLLQRGADPTHEDIDGNSAISIVQEQFDKISIKNPTSFISVMRVQPVLDMLKYWAEVRKLSQDIKPPAARKSPKP